MATLQGGHWRVKGRKFSAFKKCISQAYKLVISLKITYNKWMKHARLWLVRMLCVGLLISSVANASVACCVMMGGGEASQMQGEMSADAAREMPCHQVSGSDQQPMGDCDNCDCQHCMNMGVLPTMTIVPDSNKSEREAAHKSFSFMQQSHVLFHPPKQTS